MPGFDFAVLYKMIIIYPKINYGPKVKGKIMNRIIIGVTSGCIALLCLPGLAGADEKSSNYTVSAGLELYHGNYGTDESTDIISFLPAMDYSFSDKFSALLMVPYLYQSNNATVPIGGGHYPMQRSDQGGGPIIGGNGNQGVSGHGHGMGPPDGGHPPGHPSPPDFSDEPRSGLGDVILKMSYLLLADREKSPNVSTELYVKFPTADDEKGLGTGVYDYGVGLSLGKLLASWQLDAQVLYIMPGSTPSYELLNYWDWSLSSNYLLTSRLSLGMGLSGATNPFAGSDDLMEVELQGSFWASPRTGVWAVISFGLSDSSADYGVGVYGTVSF